MAKKHLDDESTNIDESIEDESEISADADSQQRKFDALKNTEDFADFITVQIATGKLRRSDLTDMSERDQDRLADAYEVWVSKDRPRPQLAAEDKVEVPRIQKIYRIKENGVQQIAYVAEGIKDKVGLELDPIYGTIDDEKGNKVEDPSIIIGHKRRYTIPYTDSLAKELIEKAKRHSDTVALYFKMNTINIRVQHEENFTGDFDALMKKALKSEEI